MDLDSFFVSASRLLHPELNGKPVIVGGSSDRGVVSACSYEARAFGVHSAMPIMRARKLCPEAMVISGDYDSYSYYSGMVTDIIRDKVPVFEKASIDEFYIDLSGMDRFYGCYEYASALRQQITRETGLPISFGLSTNKTVSKMATNESKPNGQLQIPAGTEKEFLAPLSVSKIPMVGEKTYAVLREMGIEIIGTLQQTPVEKLERAFGDHGRSIWRKANGICTSIVEPYSERKSISTEETFSTDTGDILFLKALLVKMTEKVAYQLRSENKLTACITVKVRYSNFETQTMQTKVAYTSSDHTLIAQVKELFDKVYDYGRAVRLLGVRVSHLVGGGQQINLFEDSEEIIHLYQAMDKLRKRFGGDAIQRAVGAGTSRRKHNPFNGHRVPGS
jgi:DNA polymerase-4